MKTWFVFLCLNVWSLSGCASVQTAPEPIRVPTATPLPRGNRPIYVIDPNNGAMTSTIWTVDPDSQRVVGGIGTRHTPEIAISPDGARVYVADSYLAKVIRGEPHDVLSVYDAATEQLLHDDIDIRGRLLYKLYPNPQPFMFLSRDGKRLFIGKYGDPDIHTLRMTILDAETFKTLAEFRSPSCFDIVPLLNGRLVCAHNATVFVVDPITGATIDEIAVPGSNIVAMTLASTRDWLYCVLGDARIAVIDLASSPRMVASQVSLGLRSGLTHLLVLSQNQERLYVGIDTTGSGSLGTANEIWAFDTSNWSRVGIFKLDDGAFHIAISHDGTQLYSVNPFQKSFSIFDTRTFQGIVVLHDLGETPAHIVVPPR